jgi:hypothetical protein
MAKIASMPGLNIKLDVADFGRNLKRAAEAAKRHDQLARIVRERNKPRAARPDYLEAFLRTWKEQKRQEQAFKCPPDVERQIATYPHKPNTLFGFQVVSGRRVTKGLIP